MSDEIKELDKVVSVDINEEMKKCTKISCFRLCLRYISIDYAKYVFLKRI